MSYYGAQTFIRGTSFEVLNSMSFNYVVDMFYINAGTGSRSYPDLPNVTLSMVGMCMIENYAGDATYTFSSSGKSISWNSNVSMLAVIYATPSTGNVGGSGYTISIKDGTQFKVAPEFTPLCLNGVNDYGSGAMTINTNVPSSSPFMAFHRGTSAIDAVTAELDRTGTNWRINVTRNLYGFRLYTFSDIAPNPPEYGLFLYRDKRIVWHQNCLPLNILNLPNNTSGGSTATSSNPLAISFCFSVRQSLRLGEAYNTVYYATAAGSSRGTWRVDTRGYAYNQQMNSSYDRGTSIMPNIPYIDCSVYDQYYQYALG